MSAILERGISCYFELYPILLQGFAYFERSYIHETQILEWPSLSSPGLKEKGQSKTRQYKDEKQIKTRQYTERGKGHKISKNNKRGA